MKNNACSKTPKLETLCNSLYGRKGCEFASTPIAPVSEGALTRTMRLQPTSTTSTKVILQCYVASLGSNARFWTERRNDNRL